MATTNPLIHTHRLVAGTGHDHEEPTRYPRRHEELTTKDQPGLSYAEYITNRSNAAEAAGRTS